MFHLWQTTDTKSQKEQADERRLPILIVLGIFLISKVIHLLKIFQVITSDLDEYRSSNAAILIDYPEAST